MKLPSLNTQILLGALLGVAGGLGLSALGKDAPFTQNTLYATGLGIE